MTYSIFVTNETVFLFYKMVFKEEEYDIPDVDVSDIFDDDDKEDQHKKPRATEYPLVTMYRHEDKDQHRKRKAEEHLLDSLEGEDDKDPNKKPRAHKSGKG
jgi:hypothetical protein